MKQATLKLKMHVQNVDIMNNNINVQKIILNSMLCIFVGLALLYVLILGNTVVNIVQRKALEKESSNLSDEVSGLELSYLSVSSSVDLALSSSMGFKETSATFATRKSLSFGVTGETLPSIKLANNEI